MLVAERRNRIKAMVMRQRSVKVSDLVHTFGVSEETIRRDLLQLEKEGLVRKNYGGAMLVEEESGSMLFAKKEALPAEQGWQTEDQYPRRTGKTSARVGRRQPQPLLNEEVEAELADIARHAAALVRPGDIVAIEEGPATLHIARLLKDVPELTIITNGLNVAETCSVSPECSIVLIGGLLDKSSKRLIGPPAEADLCKYNAHFVFLGASGVSPRKGFTCSDLYEAEIKRSMLAAGQKVIVVADHTAFGRQELVSFCGFQETDVLVTGEDADEDTLREIAELGVEVIVCPRTIAG